MIKYIRKLILNYLIKPKQKKQALLLAIKRGNLAIRNSELISKALDELEKDNITLEQFNTYLDTLRSSAEINKLEQTDTLQSLYKEAMLLSIK